MSRKASAVLPGSDMNLDDDTAPPADDAADAVSKGGDDAAFDAPPAPAASPTRNAQEDPGFIDVQWVRISEIYIPMNHRNGPLDKGKLKQLAESMKADGQLEDIRVYQVHPKMVGAMGKQYVLGFGFRRLEAAKLNEWTQIRAQRFKQATDEEIEQARVIENLHREDLSPVGRLLAVDRMLAACKGDQQLVAAKIGMDARWVADHTFISRCEQKVKDMMEAGRLLPGHLRELAKVTDPKRQLDFARDAARSEHDDVTGAMMSIDELAGLIENSRRDLKTVPWKLELPFAGKPPCLGCPSNTNSQPDLFGTTDQQAAIAGLCTHESCFEAKQKACAKGKETTVDKLKRQKAGPTADNVRAAAPSFIKESTIISFAKRQLGTVAKTGGNGAGKPAAGKQSPHKKWNDAAEKYGSAAGAWRDQAADAIFKRANKEPLLAIAVHILVITRQWQKALQAATGHRAWQDSAKTGINAWKPASPELASLIVAAGVPTLANLTKLGEADWADSVRVSKWELRSACPDALTRLWAAVGLKPADLKPAPVWDDFNPERAHGSAEPAGGTKAAAEKPAVSGGSNNAKRKKKARERKRAGKELVAS